MFSSQMGRVLGFVSGQVSNFTFSPSGPPPIILQPTYLPTHPPTHPPTYLGALPTYLLTHMSI